MKTILGLLAITLIFSSCQRGEVTKSSSVASKGLKINLFRHPLLSIPASLEAYCEDNPALICESDEANPECSITCPSGSAVVTLKQNTPDECLHGTFIPNYEDFLSEPNGDLIYHTPEGETNMDFEIFFYGCS